MRELAADGSAVFHPDHQEIHLANLALRAEQVEWRTAPGTETAIHYGGNRIGVENLQLVSGDQRIEADGALGSPSETLQRAHEQRRRRAARSAAAGRSAPRRTAERRPP